MNTECLDQITMEILGGDGSDEVAGFAGYNNSWGQLDKEISSVIFGNCRVRM